MRFESKNWKMTLTENSIEMALSGEWNNGEDESTRRRFGLADKNSTTK